MTTIFQMNASEMDNRFIDAVKSLFKDSAITISLENQNHLNTISAASGLVELTKRTELFMK